MSEEIGTKILGDQVDSGVYTSKKKAKSKTSTTKTKEQ